MYDFKTNAIKQRYLDYYSDKLSRLTGIQNTLKKGGNAAPIVLNFTLLNLIKITNSIEEFNIQIPEYISLISKSSIVRRFFNGLKIIDENKNINPNNPLLLPIIGRINGEMNLNGSQKDLTETHSYQSDSGKRVDINYYLTCHNDNFSMDAEVVVDGSAPQGWPYHNLIDFPTPQALEKRILEHYGATNARRVPSVSSSLDMGIVDDLSGNNVLAHTDQRPIDSHDCDTPRTWGSDDPRMPVSVSGQLPPDAKLNRLLASVSTFGVPDGAAKQATSPFTLAQAMSVYLAAPQ
ncbi:hypothetical protein [Pandoraea sp. PE-S2R-1]|uniref:hypothetical protein n=1 Tax=Pandoraea sp. PE-S2R-1 TaxID=1986994 RepID=UPI0011302A55|nr:hypothetical protein [Pandoraea sp. PE-S2R-1]